jgi:hypothetical protein
MMVRRRLRNNRRWARVRELVDAPDTDLARELADEFWMMLSAKPQMLAAAAVQGFGAIDRQICRFLRQPTSLSIETSESRLREHFATKLREVLRRGDYREPRRALWGIAGISERSADAVIVERVRTEQPTIAAEWKPQRSGQDPPIAGPQAIAEHLVSVFRIANAHCCFGDLHRLCWDALRPALAAVLSHERIAGEAAIAEVPTRDEFRDFALPELLQHHFDTLEPKTRAVVTLAYGHASATLRDIERTTHMSKTNAGKRLEQFRSDLGEYLKRHGYSALDERVIVLALRDILDS